MRLGAPDGLEPPPLLLPLLLRRAVSCARRAARERSESNPLPAPAVSEGDAGGEVAACDDDADDDARLAAPALRAVLSVEHRRHRTTLRSPLPAARPETKASRQRLGSEGKSGGGVRSEGSEMRRVRRRRISRRAERQASGRGGAGVAGAGEAMPGSLRGERQRVRQGERGERPTIWRRSPRYGPPHPPATSPAARVRRRS